MPITEIVIPSLKQDDSTRSKYEESIRPFLHIIESTPGSKSQFVGPVLTENGLNVKSAVKYAAGLGTCPYFLMDYNFLRPPS